MQGSAKATFYNDSKFEKTSPIFYKQNYKNIKLLDKNIG